jgi:hypothetical protein
MRFLPIAALALLSSVASAKGKHPDVIYQDAVLVKFITVTTGNSCSHNGSTSGKVDDDGSISANSSGTSDCTNLTKRHYTISVGQQTFEIEPEFTKGQKGAALATLGWSAAFAKQSVLSDQLPGTHVLVRSDSDGFWVKVGKRESRYRVVAAQ